MVDGHNSGHLQRERSMFPASIALLSNGLFIVLLLTVHFLKRDLDPSWHFISEFAIGKHGWVMQTAFLTLAVSNVAIFVAIRSCMSGIWGAIGAFLFLMGTIGLVLGGVFVTDPINTAPEFRTTSGNLHNLGGALGLGGFLGTLIFSAKLLRNDAWRTVRTAVGVATAIIVVGFLVSFVSIATIAARHNGVFGPDTPVGWPNRIGILSGCAWLLIIAWHAAHNDRKNLKRSAPLDA